LYHLGAVDRDLLFIQISNHADPQYITLLIIGLIISLAINNSIIQKFFPALRYN